MKEHLHVQAEVDDSYKQSVEWLKPDTKQCMLHDSIYVELKN